MPFGTLRDILITRYRLAASSKISNETTATPPIDPTSETELVSFSCDIAEAMTYITARKFSHPVLSTRKVLLTERGRCKLYDIYPTEMAIFKIDEECPPVAWLAPETIFIKEYSCASDIWNFAVVLWEIFSLGDIPDKGMSQAQVEKNIKQFVHLHRPPCCPEAIYSLMLSCWATLTRERPKFENIKIQLFNLIKS
ncbi:Tyrosine-protein kinase FRK [Holothuria leucospilota]|uniref:Tyrosine-protein kinase FRK n=1 Tax=Holothuria leucospilota TaxID=206669 RepID=A0A9Q1C7N8_HOLLE|nr:Tyrosine-protein kinase FRK [Holothuria leucospilota]